MFKRLLQLPSYNLQNNLLKILSQPPAVIEQESKKYVAILDIDWGNVQEALSQPQEPSSIVLRFVFNVKLYQSTSNSLEKSANLSIVLHYAAKSNQIATLHETSPLIQWQNFDKESNNLLLGKMNGDTPVLMFVSKLMTTLKNI